MALTLTDVVESRVQQRASGLRRDPAETRDAAQSRRERFSLEESDRRAALDSQTRSSSIRADAAKARTARDAASKPQDKPAQADRPSTTKSEPDRHTRPEASARPASPKPAAPARPEKPQAGTAAGQAGQEPSKGVTDDAGALNSQDKGEAAAEAKAATESAAPTVATPPLLAVFVAQPAAVPLPSLSTSQTGGSDSENESAVEAADGATEGAGVLDLGSRATAAPAAAAKPGFEAALADIGATASGGDPVPSLAAPSADPASVTGAAASPSSVAEAKSTAALHQQASAPALPAPVPLGAVPMTIGLRALGASNRFEIRLDPKELGRIDVSIDIDKDTGTVGARLVVDRPETLALLQRDASSLQQALAQTGLDASAGVSLSLRGDESQGQRNGTESGTNGQGHGAGQTDRAGLQAGTEQTPIDLMPLRTLRGLGRVDIRI